MTDAPAGITISAPETSVENVEPRERASAVHVDDDDVSPAWGAARNIFRRSKHYAHKALSAGFYAVGGTEKTLPGLKSGALPIAAGIGGVFLAHATNSFSRGGTLSLHALEGALAFGIPAGAVALTRHVVAHPTLKRTAISMAVVAGVVGGGLWVLDNGADQIPANDPFFAGIPNHVRDMVGVPHPNQAPPVETVRVVHSGPVQTVGTEFFYSSPALGKDGGRMGHFEPGEHFCATFASGSAYDAAPIVQVRRDDGSVVYASNKPGFFIQDPDSKACDQTAARPGKKQAASGVMTPKNP